MARREGAAERAEARGQECKGDAGRPGQGWTVAPHLGEDVSCVGGGRGQGGEEGGFSRRLDGVDHPKLWVFQVGGLAVGVDEHKHVVHTCGRESRAGRHRLRTALLSPGSDPSWA